MGQPYVGEIRLMANNFAPAGWMVCAGQLLPISEFETLFNLIGTTYGGDGQSTFALPNLQSRVPVHMGNDGLGNTYTIGQAGGVESVTLTNNQIPQHSHPWLASSSAAQNLSPVGFALATSVGNFYSSASPAVALASGTIGAAPGFGSQPHENRMPFVVINFVISMFGVFPSPT